MSQPISSSLAPRSRLVPAFVISASAAAVLLGCGGGDNGSLAAFGFGAAPAASPAPAPAPASTGDTDAQDMSSTPCVNEADYHEGTTIAFSAATSSPVTGRAAFQRKTVTGAREAFANVTPVPFAMDPTVQTETLTPIANGTTYTFTTTGTRKEYRDLVAGQVVIYGEAQVSNTVVTTTAPNSTPSSTGYTSTRVFDPALSIPVTMQPGATVTQRTTRTETTTYQATGAYVAPPATSTGTSGLFSLTYQGRERITTSLGSFDTCRFTYQLTTTQSGASVQTAQDQWIAAEGPYRGQMLRMSKNGAVWDVSTLNYSPN